MIDQLFHILNFLLIVAVGYYLFKRYLADMLRRNIAYDAVSFDALNRQQEELQKQKKNLTASLQRQHIEYQDLAEKIAQWREIVAQGKLVAQQEHQRIEQLVHERRVAQAHEMQLQAVHAQVIPQAVDDARLALVKIFTHDAAVRNYLQHLLQRLRKESS